MYRKSKIEMERAKLLKLYRSMIRAKHALAADEEINETLPRVEEAFNKAVAMGKPFQIEAASVFKKVG